MTFIYEKLIKPILFKADPERVHNAFVIYGKIAGAVPPIRWILSALYNYHNPALIQRVANIRFENPVGLAAGFDKECQLMKVLPSIGFGYEEVGSITARPYDGNPRPRLARLPKDKSIIVNYGLKNKGAKRLKKRIYGKRFKMVVGVSVAKTNMKFKDDKEKLDDWVKGIRTLKDCGDYLTLNVSCPNTYDTTNYCEPRLLEKLLFRIDNEKLQFKKPVFLKLTADLTDAQADAIIKACTPRKWVTGFILTNLVKDKTKLSLKSPKESYEKYKGGLSGKVVQPRALKLVRTFRKLGGGRFILIGCGGIFSAEDAYEYIKAGASLVQLITGMIYRGPATIKDINKGLVRLLEQDGYTKISEAIGRSKLLV